MGLLCVKKSVFFITLTYLLFVDNSEKNELWVPFWVPFYVIWVPFWSPFCSKLGPLWVPFLGFLGPLLIVQIYFITKQTYVVITHFCCDMGYVAFTRILSRIRAVLGLFCADFYADIQDLTQILRRCLAQEMAAGTSDAMDINWYFY